MRGPSLGVLFLLIFVGACSAPADVGGSGGEGVGDSTGGKKSSPSASGDGGNSTSGGSSGNVNPSGSKTGTGGSRSNAGSSGTGGNPDQGAAGQRNGSGGSDSGTGGKTGSTGSAGKSAGSAGSASGAGGAGGKASAGTAGANGTGGKANDGTGGSTGETGGHSGTGGSGAAGAGAGNGGAAGASGDTPACKAPATAGRAYHRNAGDNAGADCMSSNCHGGRVKPTNMTVGGTVYETKDGTTPAAGVHVTVGGVDMVTNQNGNFYSVAAATFAPAAVTYVSACPDVKVCTAPTNKGPCNSCHGSTGAAAGHIYLR